MLPLCQRPRRRRSLVLEAAVVGLGWRATVAALGSGATSRCALFGRHSVGIPGELRHEGIRLDKSPHGS